MRDDAPAAIVFRQSLGRTLGAMALPLLACVALLVMVGVSLARREEASPAVLVPLAAAAGCAAFVVARFVSARRWSLVVDAEGLSWSTGARAERVRWGSIAAFRMRGMGRRWLAEAELVGDEASPGLLRRRRMVLRNRFDQHLAAVVDVVNARHAEAMGLPAPDAALSVWREAETRYGLVSYRGPWLTIGLSVTLIVVFLLEVRASGSPDDATLNIDAGTLSTLGGLLRSAVLDRVEWYRLFSSSLLHVNAEHLVSNVVALLLAGWAIERVIGRVWLFATFCIGAVGASAVSVVLMPPNIVSVGASGAILCLFATSLLVSQRLPKGTSVRLRVQLRALSVLVPSLVPLAGSAFGFDVDYRAHTGGAVVGVALGLLLWRCWSDEERLPPFRWVAATVTVAGAGLAVASLVEAASRYAHS